MTIRVVIADDQSMVRAGFRSLLDAEPDIDVVAEAAGGAGRRRRPPLPARRRVDGHPDAAPRRRQGHSAPCRGGSASRILILTTFDLDEYVYQGLQAGASGFLLKDASPERLIDAIHVLAEGDAVLAPAVTRRVVEAFARMPSPREPLQAALGHLTEREREVLVRITRGLSNAEIADELIISETTAKTHVRRLLSKLDLRDRVQAVVFAYESGLVRTGQDERASG